MYSADLSKRSSVMSKRQMLECAELKVEDITAKACFEFQFCLKS